MKEKSKAYSFMGQIAVQRLLKLVVIIGLFVLAVFLLEKINFSQPNKNFNTDITNEIIRLK